MPPHSPSGFVGFPRETRVFFFFGETTGVSVMMVGGLGVDVSRDNVGLGRRGARSERTVVVAHEGSLSIVVMR